MKKVEGIYAIDIEETQMPSRVGNRRLKHICLIPKPFVVNFINSIIGLSSPSSCEMYPVLFTFSLSKKKSNHLRTPNS